MSYDLNILNNLSEPERKEVLKILGEYVQKGNSDIYNKLIYEDYNEIPVDIETFVDNYDYLGSVWHDKEGNSTLYDYWRKELKKIFPDNLTTYYNNAILTGSRGRGKSEIACLIGAYLLYRILCLKDPLSHFHMKSSEKIVFAFMNITLHLAEGIANSKFQNTIQSSPWFMRNGYLEGRTNKIWVPKKFNGQDVVEIKIGSQPSDVIGQPIYFAFFDEISFVKNQDIEKQKEKAKDMIDTAIGGMKTRFIYKGNNPTLLILASSKRSDKSFLESHMKKMLENDKEDFYLSDGAVWEVKPEGTYKKECFRVGVGNKWLPSVIIPDGEDEKPYRLKGYSKILSVPEDFRSNFNMDIDRALCDYAGISSSAISKYISGEAVKSILTDRIKNPFAKEILTIGNGPEDEEVQYYNFFDINKIDPKLKYKPLFIHLDMSKTGDKTGIAGVFVKGKKPSTDPNMQDKDLFYSLAFSVSIEAPKGREISFAKNRDFIRWLKRKGFNIKGITSDTFQSADLQQILKSEGYPMDILSVDRCDSDGVCKPYAAFKSAIYEKRMEWYEDDLLIQEVTDLERNIDTGKVDHPDGGSKDKVDAVCGAMYNASKHAEEFAYDYGESLETTLQTNGDFTSDNNKKQLQIAFEEELNKMFQPQAIKEQATTTNKNNQTSNENAKFNNDATKDKTKPYMDFGLGPAQVYKPQLISQGIMLW